MKQKLSIAAMILLVSFLFCSEAFAAAYAVPLRNDSSFLEYADIETYYPSQWAENQVRQAERLGIGYIDKIGRYDRRLTRKELAFVAVNLYSTVSKGGLSITDGERADISVAFVDSFKNGVLFDDSIFLAIKYGLMFGTETRISDGITYNVFSPDAVVTREQTAAVLYRIVSNFKNMDSIPAANLDVYEDSKSISGYAVDCFRSMVGWNILSGKSDKKIAPKDACTYEEVLAISIRFLSALNSELELGLDFSDSGLLKAPSIQKIQKSSVDYLGNTISILDADWKEEPEAIGYAVDCIGENGSKVRTLTSQPGVTVFRASAYKDINVYSINSRGEIGREAMSLIGAEAGAYETEKSYGILEAALQTSKTDGYYNQSFNGKGIELRSYKSNEEALLDMTDISVPVWKLDSKGNKIPGKVSFKVHREIAADVIEIFNDIYNGAEQFPINAVIGYSWRGAGSKSSHMNGLAIDINPEENYFIDTRGNILSGSFWKPYANPYSISEDGDAVRAFNKKGWYWGGIGWDTTGKDYMHFSYTGV